MIARLSSLLLVSALLVATLIAKDKNKAALPADVLRAETVRVVIDPNAGEPLNQPNANATARENVEKALREWGRFRVLVPDGAASDLIISVRTGSHGAVQPTLHGGPIDQRPGTVQTTDSTILIATQHGRPPATDPNIDPQNEGVHLGTEMGSKEDAFVVYRGGISDPLNSPPVWRYIAKDCLRAPNVTAVEQFRKALVEAEKPGGQKNP